MASVLKPGLRSAGIVLFSGLGWLSATIQTRADYARAMYGSIAVVDGDDLKTRRNAGSLITVIIEPDVAAAIADHHALIVLEIVVGILLKHVGLELRANDGRIVLEDLLRM